MDFPSATFEEPRLTALFRQKELSCLDYYFARAMARIFPKEDPLIPLTCALVSRALSNGYIFFDLDHAAKTGFPLPGQGHPGSGREPQLRLPPLSDWIRILKHSAMVEDLSQGPGGMDQNGFGRGRKNRPLVLDRALHLYFAKYYDLQSRLVENIGSRILAASPAMDPDFMNQGLARAFKGADPVHTGPQQAAVRKALTRNLTLISGGPGTGKTHITRMIRTLLEEYARIRRLAPPRILALAPTGKAASRLRDGATIHATLIPLPTRPGFVHGKDNPLMADMVIVDEASMIDIALMTRLLEAVPAQARVILLGDENQLSPVQAGAVFNEICRTRKMAPCLSYLEHNFRSGGRTGLENLARAIRVNDFRGLKTILNQKHPEIVFEDTGKDGCRNRALTRHITQGYQEFMAEKSLLGALDKLDTFRILCAHNQGECGTLQMNHLCEKILRNREDSGITNEFFRRIIMIRLNDYDRGLFNGDTGVVFAQGGPKGTGRARVGFRTADKGVRVYRFADLPDHETAFAVTVHKSQGSEFDSILMVIPDQVSPVVTRQLLYTGITRARKKAIILGPMAVIQKAMEIDPERTSNVSCFLERFIERNHQRMGK